MPSHRPISRGSKRSRSSHRCKRKRRVSDVSNESNICFDPVMDVAILPFGVKPAPAITAQEYFYKCFMEIFPLASTRSQAIRRNLEKNVDVAWRALSEEAKDNYVNAAIQDRLRFDIQQRRYESYLRKTEEYKERNRINKEKLCRKVTEKQKMDIEIAREKTRKFSEFVTKRNNDIE